MLAPSAEAISAFAAVASAVTAYFAFRTSNKVLSTPVLPIISGNYIFDKEYIQLQNIGSGPALNLRLQPTSKHYVDIRQLIEFELEQVHNSIYPNEIINISIAIKGTKNISTDDRKFYNYSFIDMVKTKPVGIIYNDIYGKKWISKLIYTEDKSIRGRAISIKHTKTYGLVYYLWDRLHSKAFKISRRLRERKYANGKTT